MSLQRISLLLALNLLVVCLPAVAQTQEEQTPYVARRPYSANPDRAARPSGRRAPFIPSPEANAKVNALIAEVMEPEASLELQVTRSKVIRTKAPVTRVSITEPKTLQVVQYTPTEFELIGLRAGQTSLTFWFGDNQALRYLVEVRPLPENREASVGKEYRELQDKINEMFPNSLVQLIPLADKLIVRGQARDSAEAAQILSILTSGYGGYGGGRGYGMIDVGTAVNPVPGSNDVTAHSIINLMETPGEQQVMLKVRIAQLNRTAARAMSTQLRINSGVLALSTSSGLSAAFSSVLNPEDLRLALTAVKSTGYTKILAEPNLVTLNGQSATFHSGGSFAVPTAVGIGGVSGINTAFETYGTRLIFTPSIIDKDRIRLTVSPSVSAVDRGLTVNGIPGTTSRSASTTVDMRVGQWLAIAGLLEDTQIGSKARVPFVGDIPVLGVAFGQTSVSREETELIILVSPELVHPMDARETPLILPGMEVAEPGDTSFYLGGAYVAQYDRAHQGGSCNAAPCASNCPPQPPVAAAARSQAMREAMTRPDYQRSEKYYVYGQHGVSQ